MHLKLNTYGCILRNCRDSLPYTVVTDCAVLAHWEMDSFVLIDEAGWKAVFQYLQALWVSKLESSDRNIVAVWFIPCCKEDLCMQ